MKLLLILFTCLPILTFGQIDYENPPWKLSCDSLTSQTEMNICSGKKTIVADSIMNVLYEKNLKYYNEIVTEEKKQLINNSDPSIFKLFETVLASLKSSQVDFIKYRKSVVDLENAIWDGGTIRPLMSNMVYLNLTIARIKRLENLYEDNINK
jgi:uncharacterized protein YecT (DUF1311 family)